jgi:VanZ family protein
VLILVLTSLPAIPSEVPRGTDKVAHFALYAVLGALCAPQAVQGGRRRLRTIVILVAILLFAALDETHQILINGRVASAADSLADAFGASVGFSPALLVYTRKGDGR